MLIEEELQPNSVPMTGEALSLIESGTAAASTIECFEFVPSDYQYLWNVLHSLRRTSFPNARFCEWGSGIGIVAGMAAMLGFDSVGVEINEQLAVASKSLHKAYDLDVEILVGDYMEFNVQADLYFAYVWPGKREETQQHFLDSSTQQAKLLLSYGASAIELKYRG